MRYVDACEQKVKTFMEQHAMISPGERVIAGVSGGADSVCLLFVLLRFMEEIPFSLHVVHVNHGIRREAPEDAAYVKLLCDRYQIPFTLIEENVRERAAREKRSEEEMGRLVRYEAFERVRLETGAHRIAVAHNSNDRAETMLFHLFRGSGLSGLCGIRPVRDRIIRPILCLERAEIERYLEEKGVDWCQDMTNEADDYTRNRIRHHILPYAEEQVVQGSVTHMSRTAAMLLETEEMLERMTAQARQETVRSERGEAAAEEYILDCGKFTALEPVIGKRLLYTLLKELSPSGKDIAFVHIEDVMELCGREGNRYLCLPYGIIAGRQYAEVRLCRKNAGPECEADSLGQTPAEATSGKKTSSSGEPNVEFQVFPYEKNQNIPENRYTKWLDYDRINEPLTVRTRQQGDYLSIRGADGTMIHKSVKDYMITEKIPKQERDRILLVAEGNHILWIVGYRISEYYKISENTKRILQVQLKREEFTKGETEEDNGRTC